MVSFFSVESSNNYDGMNSCFPGCILFDIYLISNCCGNYFSIHYCIIVVKVVNFSLCLILMRWHIQFFTIKQCQLWVYSTIYGFNYVEGCLFYSSFIKVKITWSTMIYNIENDKASTIHYSSTISCTTVLVSSTILDASMLACVLCLCHLLFLYQFSLYER